MGKGRERSGVKKAASTPAMAIKVNGVEYVIDPTTLSLAERQQCKKALAGLGYEPDELDHLGAAIWVVIRRSKPETTFEEVCEGLTIGSLSEAQEVQADPASPEV